MSIQIQKYNPSLKKNIVIGSHASAGEKNLLITLINLKRNAFAKSLDKLGSTDVIKKRIEEILGVKPICAKPYSTSRP